MKIRPEHFRHMRDALAAFGAEKVAAHRAFLVTEGKAKDLEMRLRWDLTFKAGLGSWLSSEVYPYADDSHIDTALRAIMRELYP